MAARTEWIRFVRWFLTALIDGIIDDALVECRRRTDRRDMAVGLHERTKLINHQRRESVYRHELLDFSIAGNTLRQVNDWHLCAPPFIVGPSCCSATFSLWESTSALSRNSGVQFCIHRCKERQKNDEEIVSMMPMMIRCQNYHSGGDV